MQPIVQKSSLRWQRVLVRNTSRTWWQTTALPQPLRRPRSSPCSPKRRSVALVRHVEGRQKRGNSAAQWCGRWCWTTAVRPAGSIVCSPSRQTPWCSLRSTPGKLSSCHLARQCWAGQQTQTGNYGVFVNVYLFLF